MQNMSLLAPRAILAVPGTDSNTQGATFTARCPCGWNAASFAINPDRARAELGALIEAHRRVCSRLPQS